MLDDYRSCDLTVSAQSCQGSSPLVAAKRSISFLHSRRLAKANFCATEIYEAAIGDLKLPAILDAVKIPSLDFAG